MTGRAFIYISEMSTCRTLPHCRWGNTYCLWRAFVMLYWCTNISVQLQAIRPLTPQNNGQQFVPAGILQSLIPSPSPYCFEPPFGCSLECPYGYTKAGDVCMCLCQLDPCLSKMCGAGEVCVRNKDSTKCVSMVSRQQQLASSTGSPPSESSPTIGQCPRPTGRGPCVELCSRDTDCQQPNQKCCSNGCGRECRPLVNVVPIQSSLLIQPLLGANRPGAAATGEAISPSLVPSRPVVRGNVPWEQPSLATTSPATMAKPGQCPSHLSQKERRCVAECQGDTDCAGVAKCCDNGCAKVCAPPDKAPGCVHLLSAVERLPHRLLNNGYKPSCASTGQFSPVQCDSTFCWCVHSESGHEILGTKLLKTERAFLNCRGPRYCGASECAPDACPFGLQTDDRGCPLPTCVCKNVCHRVECEHKLDECQLVEPDCAEPPCAPVPRCMLNPCPEASPMTLANGITALCRKSSQCWDGFWCHQVGYNGFGFCCPAPETPVRPGTCDWKPVQTARQVTQCPSECKVDSDCASPRKCCFEGCGLKCMSTGQDSSINRPDPNQKTMTVSSSGVEQANAYLLSTNPRLATCPFIPQKDSSEECVTKCETSADCSGLRICCAVGCSRSCVYPQVTTECLQQGITQQVYALQTPPLKCDFNGNFEEVQCAEHYCYCVDPTTGVEVSGSRVSSDKHPYCIGSSTECPSLQCKLNCPQGYELNEEGCPTCKCINKCAQLNCDPDEVCILADVDCLKGSKCWPQPRCVKNVCKKGEPYSSNGGVVEQCNGQCPVGYWCNRVGLPGAGGVCCAVVDVSGREDSSSSSVANAIAIISQQHPGICPRTQVQLDRECASSHCGQDGDCKASEKCCFDGCTTMCLEIKSPSQIDEAQPKTTSSSRNEEKDSSEKLGECPALGGTVRPECPSSANECSTDSDCPTIQKCCFDGCSKRCLFAQKTSPCLHLQAAIQLLAIKGSVECGKGGNFQEVQCNDEFCWCAQPVSGEELEGTRVSSLAAPDCKAARVCPSTYCSSNKSCPYGYEKDSNGCNTCECIDPCKDVECPNPWRICLPEPADCLANKKQCGPYHVPKCVVNVCVVREALLVRESTLRPEFCRRSSDCPQDYHCRLLNNDNGFCCYGIVPVVNRGKCPKVSDWALVQPAERSLCELKCTQDEDCRSEEEKCCFNGCGMACTSTSASSTDEQTKVEVGAVNHPSTSKGQSPSKAKKKQKIGECAKVEPLANPELCGTIPQRDVCSQDEECVDNQKCCFDGCSKTCLHPATTTECLHARAAADAIGRLASSTVFQPACDKNGAYERIQRHNGMAWCVDSSGREIQGTKGALVMLTSCQGLARKSCPITSCTKNCPHGFETDLLGCQQCICKDPCRDAKCPVNTVCRMTRVSCLNSGAANSSCRPVPKCLLNVCLRGEPLEDFTTGELQGCNEMKGPKCPPGWYCHKFGLEKIAYCCAGLVQQSQLLPSAKQCPSLPIVPEQDNRPSQLKCRLSEECAKDESCCFNGRGMSCLTTKELQPHRKNLTQVIPEVVTSWMAVEASNIECPPNVFTNPGCSSQCAINEECQGRSPFMRCCGYGCGKRCLFGAKLPACVHLLATTTREVDKLADVPTSLGRPTVQCTTEGLFRRVQCDVSIRECWCVDPNSGIELVGTRFSSLTNVEPNCQFPRKCPTVCPSASELNCEHGIRLDQNGCPLNSACQCKNVCQDFKCSRPSEVCVPRKVLCLSKPCPPVPVCLPNPCSKGSTSPTSLVTTCSADADCANDHDCRFTVAAREADIDRVGICCSTYDIQKMLSHHGVISSTKVGVCPGGFNSAQAIKEVKDEGCMNECESDGECAGIQKCCDVGCRKSCVQPLASTNCLNMMAAIQQFQTQQVSNSLFLPLCDARLGTYLSNQCDREGHCWCVDKNTGRPVSGTRSFQPIGDVCTNRKACNIQCDETLSACFFGLEVDANGCPKNSNCLCRSLCDQVNCPSNQLCIMRPRKCREEVCLPVPTCEDNPCTNNQRPAVDARSQDHLMCNNDRKDWCPSGFYCTAYDENRVGVCCPGKEPSMSSQQNVCLYSGISLPLLSNQPAVACSVSPSPQTNLGCPNTHYCVTKGDLSSGVCCPTKRTVCNLKLDEGRCTQASSRFYYDTESESCLQFIYTSCQGNLNNFLTLHDCQKFCVGSSMDLTRTLVDDDGTTMMDLYTVGFSLVGPMSRTEKHSTDFNRAVMDYLTNNYDLEEKEVRDLFTKDDNTVRFTIIAPDAKEKAERVSDAVSADKFHFNYKGETYRAEPRTWFSKQTTQSSDVSDGGVLFWVILVASILFALVVVVVLCCGYNFLRIQPNTDNNSIYREVSPAPYGSFLQQQQRNPAVSGNSATIDHKQPNKIEATSADNLHALRANIRDENHLLTPSSEISGRTSSHISTVSPQNNARTRTTLYY